MFSIVLRYPDVELGEFGDGWIKGRFNGVQSIEFPLEDASGDFVRVEPQNVRDLFDGVTDETEYFYWPRAHHVAAGRWFNATLRQSVGSNAVDGSMSDVARPETEGEGKSRVRAWKYLFHPDLIWSHKYHKPECAADLDHPDNQPAPYTGRITLQDPAGDKGATVSLVSLEFVEYDDPRRLFTDSATPGLEGKSTTTRFLILHAAAENLSSELLEEVSLSLYRSRHKVQRAGGDKDEGVEVSLLKLFVGEALKYVPCEDGCVPKLSKGGYLYCHRRDDSPRLKPYRVVTAIPAREGTGAPSLWRDGGWPDADKWGWALSTGADHYFGGIPALDEQSLDRSRAARFHDWTIHVHGEGMALVCTRPFDTVPSGQGPMNREFWMLASTRFVDLAILVRRAAKYLELISRALNTMVFDTNRAQGLLKDNLDWKSPEVERAMRELNDSLIKFQNLQRDFLTFRDKLWFESVPNRDNGTIILKALQRATGVSEHFKDIADEIALRKDVYATQYQQMEVAFQNLKADLREREREARAKQDTIEQEQRQKQQDQRERVNLVLGVGGIVLGVPAVVEQYPFDSQWGSFYWSLALIVLLVVVWIGWRVLPRKKQPLAETNEPPRPDISAQPRDRDEVQMSTGQRADGSGRRRQLDQTQRS